MKTALLLADAIDARQFFTEALGPHVNLVLLDPPVEPDRPLTKAEAAEYLGFSVCKLERCMAKRQIEYEKYGTGQTSTVRFRQSELDKYREKRKVTSRKMGI